MWILSALILLAIFILGLLLIVGIILLVIGKFKKNDNKRLFKIGLKITFAPIIIIALICGYIFIHDAIAPKPNRKDLIGKYEMSPDSFHYNENEKHILQFFDNGTYRITETPDIELCENGEYDVDYQYEGNEISFECNNGYKSATINRGFTEYRIEFVIGDPDSGESIYFQKVE